MVWLAPLVACTSASLPEAPSELEVLALTSDDPDADLPERTEVVEMGGARLGADGEMFAEGGGWGEYPVVEVGDAVRVVARRRGVRTLLWLDRESLSDVVYQSTWVGADGHRAAAGAPGVRLPGGSPVGLDGGTVHLGAAFVDDDVHVADGLVDQVWRVPDDDEGDEEGEFAGVEGGTAIRDDDGRTLVRLSTEYEGVIVATGHVLARDEARGVLVVVSLGSVDSCGREPVAYARGWVWPDEMDSLGMAGFGGGCSRCGGWGGYTSSNFVSLPAGAALYDAPDGSLVGITEEDVSLGRGEDDGAMPGWRAVLAPTPFGDGQVWARDEGEVVD